MPVLFEQFPNCFEGNDDLSMNVAKRPKICAQSNEEFYTSKKKCLEMADKYLYMTKVHQVNKIVQQTRLYIRGKVILIYKDARPQMNHADLQKLRWMRRFLHPLYSTIYRALVRTNLCPNHQRMRFLTV